MLRENLLRARSAEPPGGGECPLPLHPHPSVFLQRLQLEPYCCPASASLHSSQPHRRSPPLSSSPSRVVNRSVQPGRIVGASQACRAWPLAQMGMLTTAVSR